MREKFLYFMMWCLFLCIPVKIQGQVKFGRDLVKYSKRFIVVAEIPKKIPRNTPGSAAYLKLLYEDPKNLKATRGYHKPIVILDNVKAKQGDTIFVGVRAWTDPFEVKDGAIRLKEPNDPYFIFDGKQIVRKRRFPIGVTELYPSEYRALNLTVSAKLKDTTEPIEEDFNVTVGATEYKTRSLFGIDKNTYWKKQFVDFLNAHSNEFKDQNNEYSINTSNANEEPNIPNTNCVSQAFYSFLNRWVETKEIEHVNAPACLRFLKDCGIKVSTEETTYITWFRKAYYNGHQELAPRDYEVGVENLHNKKIDDMVERWFSIIDSQE